MGLMAFDFIDNAERSIIIHVIRRVKKAVQSGFFYQIQLR
jgi:hypothetical protein